MFSMILALLVSVHSYAAPVNLLERAPTEITGTVQKTDYGTLELQAGLFGAAAVYHRLNYAGKAFDMKATFARTRGSDGVGLVIPVGSQNVALVLGGWGSRYDGLNRVDGYDPSDNRNPTRRASKVKNGEDLELLIQVRPGKIVVHVNGQKHIELDTTKHKLSVLDDIKKRFSEGLGLYVVNGALDLSAWTIEGK